MLEKRTRTDYQCIIIPDHGYYTYSAQTLPDINGGLKMKIIHAIIFLQNWGASEELITLLKRDPHVISLFHIMGRHSYLMDANFDSKPQLEKWIAGLKSVNLPSGVPAVISIETQKIIDVLKAKTDYGLSDYLKIGEKYHLFVKIDNPRHDDKLIALLGNSGIVMSTLHVQGESSFIAEVITGDYAEYKNLLSGLKTLDSIHHLETQEVISVLKYRNKIMDEGGNLVSPAVDIREMYTL
jgi:hypothetical protein